MKIETKSVENNWKQFTLGNDHGMAVSLLNYGGIVTEILTPDKDGNFGNVVLGYEDIGDYTTDEHFLGALIGRVAGRIKGASFTIEGEPYVLEQNDGKNHLHGAASGFHRVLWDTEPFKTYDTVGVKLSHTHKESSGYPGELDVVITYVLTNKNELIINYAASTNKTTPVTLTNHSYFNLTGNLKDTVHNHQVTINSHQYLELDFELLPTGKIMDVANSPFDFQQCRKLNDGIVSDFAQNTIVGNGYDHYFLFDCDGKGSVIVEDPISRRKLTIKSDQPGMVMYTSTNMVGGLKLKGGLSEKYLGICFETQASPASLHDDTIPSILLNVGEVYEKQTVFSFSLME